MIAEEMKATSFESFWAGISFLLTSVLFMPVTSIISDIFGRKSALYGCMIFFATGSIIIGSAPDMNVLIAGRTIQGMGAGGLETLCEIILTDMTTLKERPFWLGVLGFVYAAGTVLGPVVGGAFSEFVSWRWIAWINLPFIGIAMVLIPIFLKLRATQQSFKEKFARIDWIGILLFILGLTLLTLAVTWGGTLYPWDSWQTLVPMLTGIAVLVAFGFYEVRPSDPIIPYHFFTSRTKATALFNSFLHGTILYTVLFYLPLYLEGAVQRRPLRAAVEAFPLCFTVMPFVIVTAFAIEYVRRYRWSIWLGWTLTAIGMGTLSLLTATSNAAERSGYQIVGGIGLGMLYPALSLPLQASFSEDTVGIAMGMFVFARHLGAVAGVALGASVFTNSFSRDIKTLRPLPVELKLLESGKGAVDFVPKLRKIATTPELIAKILQVRQIYADSVRWIWIAMAVLAAVGFITSLIVRELTLEREGVGKQTFLDGTEKDQKNKKKSRKSGKEEKETAAAGV